MKRISMAGMGLVFAGLTLIIGLALPLRAIAQATTAPTAEASWRIPSSGEIEQLLAECMLHHGVGVVVGVIAPGGKLPYFNLGMSLLGRLLGMRAGREYESLRSTTNALLEFIAAYLGCRNTALADAVRLQRGKQGYRCSIEGGPGQGDSTS